MNNEGLPDPPDGPDPRRESVHGIDKRVVALETKWEAVATREWVWKNAFSALVGAIFLFHGHHEALFQIGPLA